MIVWALRASICAAALVLAGTYALRPAWAGMALSLSLGMVSLTGQAAGWRWITGFALGGFVLLAAAGVVLNLSPFAMLLGTTLALVAWDLDRFAARLSDIGQVANEQALARAHLYRLSLVAMSAMLLGAFALNVRVSLSFGWALFLSFTILFVLSRLLRPAK